jgi:hypothetical protein
MSEKKLYPVREVEPPADVPIETMTEDQCLALLMYTGQMLLHHSTRRTRALARFAALHPPGRDGADDPLNCLAEEAAAELRKVSATAATRPAQDRDVVLRHPGPRSR